MKWHQSIGFLFIIAGHQHRHYSIKRLSPVTEHSDIGLGPLIASSDWFRHLHYFSFRYRTDGMPDSDSRAFTKTVRRCKGVHPALPFCWSWARHRNTSVYCTAAGGVKLTLPGIGFLSGNQLRHSGIAFRY